MSSDSTDDLQFATPEPVTPTASRSSTPVQKCAGCGRPITSTYYALRDKVVCPQCVQQFNAGAPGGQVLQLLRAAVFGIGGGILGAIIWYAVRTIAHAEIGLVAIVVGYLVGKAVRKGSGGRGGPEFQIMAVVITYCGICANYVPDVIQAMHTPFNQLTAAQMGRLAIFILRIPFLDGANNAIGLLIIGFALWEAWKFNRPRRLAITGPYQVGSPRSGGVVV